MKLMQAPCALTKARSFQRVMPWRLVDDAYGCRWLASVQLAPVHYFVGLVVFAPHAEQQSADRLAPWGTQRSVG
jgi:hypothetical protein